MDQKMLHQTYMPPDMKGRTWTFPYFAPQGSQNVYVMVPTFDPNNFGNLLLGNTSPNRTPESFFTQEEEILPDFRCKICSVAIFNYCDFKIHLDGHMNDVTDTSNEYLSSGECTLEEAEVGAPKPELSEVRPDICRNSGCESSRVMRNKILLPAVSKTLSDFFSLQKDYRNDNFTPKIKNTLGKSSNNTSATLVSLKASKPYLAEVLKQRLDHALASQKSNDVKYFEDPVYAGFEIYSKNNERPEVVIDAPGFPKIKTVLIPDKFTDCISRRKQSESNIVKVPNCSSLKNYSKTHESRTAAVISSRVPLIQGKGKHESLMYASKQSDGVNTVPIATHSSFSSKSTTQIEKTNASLEKVNSTENNSEEEALDYLDFKLASKSVDDLTTQTNTKVDGTAKGIINESSLLERNPGQTLDNLKCSKPVAMTVSNNSTKSWSEIVLQRDSNEHFNELSFSKRKLLQTLSNLNESKPLDYAANAKIPNYAELGFSIAERTSNQTFNEYSASYLGPKQSQLKREHNMLGMKPLTGATDKIFHCPYCLEVSKSQLEMNEHVIQHKEISVACVLCESTFAGISSLRKHLSMFHCKDKGRRQCPYCSYRCFQTSDLDKHVARKHTRDFKYKCPHCIRGFATPKELNNHLKRKHDDISKFLEVPVRKDYGIHF